MHLRSILLAPFLAATALSMETQAFDDLLKAVNRLPAVMQEPFAFEYASPPQGFTASSDFLGLSDMALAQALVAGKVDPMTGIDFGAVTGIIQLGEPPKLTTILIGSDGYTYAVPKALLERNFAEKTDASVPIFSKGEDYAIDLKASTEPDPLARGLGQSQRIALFDDYLIRTAGWPEMDRALEAMAGGGEQNIWGDAVQALRNAAGKGAHLDFASGWTLAAFAGYPTAQDIAPSSSGKNKTAKRPEETIFPFSIIAATSTAEGSAVHIAIPYPDAELAQRAGEMVAAKVPQIIPDAEARVETFAPDVAGTVPVVVVSVDLPATSANEPENVYAGWLSAIVQRDFEPLMFGS